MKVGGGARATSQPACSGSTTWKRTNRGLLSSAVFPSPPEAANVFGCPIKIVPVPCGKASSQMSPHTDSKMLKDR